MSKILIDEATVKLALEALEEATTYTSSPIWSPSMTEECKKAITALREALAEQPAQQDSTCSNALRAQGKAYPRTCKKCGLGPCVELAQQALDKKAENARELGLDYEPAQQEPVAPTAVEMQNAAANLALMREMWGNSDEPAAKVNDDGFIVETGLLLSPGTQLYTSPPAQRTWVGLTDEEYAKLAEEFGPFPINEIEAKLKEKNNG